jgi:hypothetical protein
VQNITFIHKKVIKPILILLISIPIFNRNKSILDGLKNISKQKLRDILKNNLQYFFNSILRISYPDIDANLDTKMLF